MKARYLFFYSTFLFIIHASIIEALVTIDTNGNAYIQSHGQVLGQSDIDLESLDFEDFKQFYRQIESELNLKDSDLNEEDLYTAFEELKGKIQVLQHADGSVETRILDQESSMSSIAIVNGNQIESKLVMPDGTEESIKFESNQSDNTIEPLKHLSVKPMDNKQLEISGLAKNGIVPKIKDDQIRLDKNKDEEDLVIVTNSENKLVFAQGMYGVATDYQVSIDSNDNNLIIQTPNQYLKVNALPGKVISSLKVSGEIDSLNSDKLKLNNFDFLSPETQILDLVETENDLLYQVNGHKRVKILGVFPTEIDKKISVSVKNGQVQKIEQNARDRFISMISL